MKTRVPLSLLLSLVTVLSLFSTLFSLPVNAQEDPACIAVPDTVARPAIYIGRELCSIKIPIGKSFIGKNEVKLKTTQDPKIPFKLIDLREKKSYNLNGKPGQPLYKLNVRTDKLPRDFKFQRYSPGGAKPVQLNLGFVYEVQSDGVLFAQPKDIKIKSCTKNGFDVTDIARPNSLCKGNYILLDLKAGDYVPPQTGYVPPTNLRAGEPPVVELITCEPYCQLKIENDPKLYILGECISPSTCISSFYDPNSIEQEFMPIPPNDNEGDVLGISSLPESARDETTDLWATLTIFDEQPVVCPDGTNIGVLPEFVATPACDSLNNPLDINNPADVTELNRSDRGYNAVVLVPEKQGFKYSGQWPNMPNPIQNLDFWPARFITNELGQRCVTKFQLTQEQLNDPNPTFNPDEVICESGLYAGNYLIFNIDGQMYASYGYFLTGFTTIGGVQYARISVFYDWVVDPESGVPLN